MASRDLRRANKRPASAVIEFKGMRFLITDRPSDANIQNFITELQTNNVSIVVRVTENTYKTEELESHGIVVRDLLYDVGELPPQHVIKEWFQTLRQKNEENPETFLAVTGLGRAPVLVALALIELGLTYEEAVEMIRDKRRGAINAKQLTFLEKYRPKSRLSQRTSHKSLCCLQLPVNITETFNRLVR